nr:hypothetical protein [Nocardia wallacei]
MARTDAPDSTGARRATACGKGEHVVGRRHQPRCAVAEGRRPRPRPVGWIGHVESLTVGPIATTTDILHRIASGEVVHPTSASFIDYYHHPDVTYVPLQGNPLVEGALVWVTAMENAAIRAFAEGCGGSGRTAPASE